MSKVKIGVVGAGNIAKTHLKAYKNVKDAEIYALCDIDEKNLNETGDMFGIERRYTSIEEMIENCPELDACDICVWNINHSPCAVKALDAGLHVLCEKPMAYNTEQAEKMVEAAKRNNKLLMIGFVLRFSDQAKIAKDFVERDMLGEIYYSKAQYVRRHGNPGGWFGDTSLSGGGPVIDLGVHVIDLTRMLMGGPKPVSVYAATFNKLGSRDYLKNNVEWIAPEPPVKVKCDVEDFGTAIIRYDNGAVTYLETAYDINGEDITNRRIYGTKGGMDLSTDDIKIRTECNGFLSDISVNTKNYKESKDMFEMEMQHFVDCVLGKTECRAKAEDGVVVMKILDAIYESARTGHEVIIEN